MNYSYNTGGSGLAAGLLIVYLLLIIAVYVVVFAGVWKMYAKAGKPGWVAIIPFYNWWVWLEIIDRPRWWFWAIFAVLLAWVPFLNIFIILGLYFIVGMAVLDMVKCFGKGSFHEIGLVVLPFIFAPILGFGGAQYIGPVAAGLPHATGTAPPATPPMGGAYASPPPPAGQAYLPPTPGPAAPPPLAQPLMPQPLKPPPAQAAPPTPPPTQPAPPESPTPPPPPPPS
jgi:hypothetical protein